MRKLLLLTLLAFAYFNHSSAQEVVPNQVIVKITDESDINKIITELNDSFTDDAVIRVKKELSHRMAIWLLTHNDEISSQDLINKLYSNTQVIDAQLNRRVHLRETVPNDTEYAQQWQHQNIQSELAWDITTGGMTGLGDEIVVCVIEGGNAQHVDLEENCWRNTLEIEDNGIDDDENGYIDDFDGWNVQSDSDAGVFQGGHGTQVMGMIGARGNNDQGVSGANWDVKIMSVAGQNLFNEASLVEAYDYPYNMRQLYEETNGAKGAFVVATNASWGIDGGDPEDAPIWCGIYQTLGEGGILSCGATSNSALDIDAVGDLPTACSSDYMISVTATNVNDVRTFSAFGATTIDLGAPGDQIYTTQGANAYGFTSGTSFASPITAGVIGLLYSTPCSGLGVLAHEDPQAAADLVRQVLLDGVDPIENLVGETVTGGRLNAFNSIQLLLAACSDDTCFSPFSANVVTEDNVNVAVEWGAFNEDHTFDFRFRQVGEADWTEVLELTEPSYDLGELAWCSEYEYEIRTLCSDTLQAEWTAYPTIVTDGCCVAPDFSLFAGEAIDENSIAVEWPSVLAAESFIVSYTPIGGTATEVTDISETDYMITGLEACTEYEITVSTSCAEETSGSTETLVIRTFGCGHCTDADFCLDSHETSEEEFIDSFSIGEFTNESGNDGSYALFEDEDIILNRGNVFEISAEAGFPGQPFGETFTVWLDANQDGEFSEDEMLAHAANVQSFTDEALIPADALLGNTRLRISMVFTNETTGPQDPCGEFAWGETEDYCVTVEAFDNVSEINNVASIYPNPVNQELFVSLSNLDAATHVKITDTSGKEVFNTNITSSTTQVNTSDLNSGLYFIEIYQAGNKIQTARFIKQ